jgi:hypothetical protein
MIGARGTLDSKKEENSREYTFAEHFTALLLLDSLRTPKFQCRLGTLLFGAHMSFSSSYLHHSKVVSEDKRGFYYVICITRVCHDYSPQIVEAVICAAISRLVHETKIKSFRIL